MQWSVGDVKGPTMISCPTVESRSATIVWPVCTTHVSRRKRKSSVILLYHEVRDTSVRTSRDRFNCTRCIKSNDHCFQMRIYTSGSVHICKQDLPQNCLWHWKLMLTFLLRKRALLHERKKKFKRNHVPKTYRFDAKHIKVCATIGVCRATHTISDMHISLCREPHMYSSPTRSCFRVCGPSLRRLESLNDGLKTSWKSEYVLKMSLKSKWHL